MSKNVTLEDILQSGLGDASLGALVWEGDDLIITLELPYSDPRRECLSLCFAYTSNLRVDIDFRDYVGLPLLFEATFTRQASNRWEVVLNFGAAPEGSITFKCNDIRLETKGARHRAGRASVQQGRTKKRGRSLREDIKKL